LTGIKNQRAFLSLPMLSINRWLALGICLVTKSLFY
jgi:hypothetical protein